MKNEFYISFITYFKGLEDEKFYHYRVFSIKLEGKSFINTDFQGSIKGLKKIEYKDAVIIFDAKGDK